MNSRKMGAHCAKNMAVGMIRLRARSISEASSVEKRAHMRIVPSCPPQNDENTYLKSMFRAE